MNQGSVIFAGFRSCLKKIGAKVISNFGFLAKTQSREGLFLV